MEPSGSGTEHQHARPAAAGAGSDAIPSASRATPTAGPARDAPQTLPELPGSGRFGVHLAAAHASGDIGVDQAQFLCRSWLDMSTSISLDDANALHSRWLGLLCAMQGRPGAVELQPNTLTELAPGATGGVLRTASDAVRWDGRAFVSLQDELVRQPAHAFLTLPAWYQHHFANLPRSGDEPTWPGTDGLADLFTLQLAQLQVNPAGMDREQTGAGLILRTGGGDPLWAGCAALDGPILTAVRDAIALSKAVLGRASPAQASSAALDFPVPAKHKDFVPFPLLKRTLEALFARQLSSMSGDGRLSSVALLSWINSYPMLQLTLDGAPTTVSNVLREARSMADAAQPKVPAAPSASSHSRQRRKESQRRRSTPSTELCNRLQVRFVSFVKTGHRFKSRLDTQSAPATPSTGRADASIDWTLTYACSLADLLLPPAVSQPLVAAAMVRACSSPVPTEGGASAAGSPAGAASPDVWRLALLRANLHACLVAAPQGCLDGFLLQVVYNTTSGGTLPLWSMGVGSLGELLNLAGEAFQWVSWFDAACGHPVLCDLPTDTTGARWSLLQQLSVGLADEVRTSSVAAGIAREHAESSLAAVACPGMVALELPTPLPDSQVAPPSLAAHTEKAGSELVRAPSPPLMRSYSHEYAEKVFAEAPAPPVPEAQPAMTLGDAKAQLAHVPPEVVDTWKQYLWRVYVLALALVQVKRGTGDMGACMQCKHLRQVVNDGGWRVPEQAPTAVPTETSSFRATFTNFMSWMPCLEVRRDGSAGAAVFKVLTILLPLPLLVHVASEESAVPARSRRQASVPHLQLQESLLCLSQQSQGVQDSVSVWLGVIAQRLGREAEQAKPAPRLPLAVPASPQAPLPPHAKALSVITSAMRRLSHSQEEALEAGQSRRVTRGHPKFAALSAAKRALACGLQAGDVPLTSLGQDLRRRGGSKHVSGKLADFIQSHCQGYVEVLRGKGANKLDVWVRLVQRFPALTVRAPEYPLRRRTTGDSVRSEGTASVAGHTPILLRRSTGEAGDDFLVSVDSTAEGDGAAPELEQVTSSAGTSAEPARVEALIRKMWSEREATLQRLQSSSNVPSRQSGAGMWLGPCDVATGEPIAGFVQVTPLFVQLIAHGLAPSEGLTCEQWLRQLNLPLETLMERTGGLWVRLAPGLVRDRVSGATLNLAALRALGLPEPGGPGVADRVPVSALPERHYVEGEQIGVDEDIHHEFKKCGAGPKGLLLKVGHKYIIGFLNAEGGTLYFGVGDDGDVIGCRAPRAVRDQVNLTWDNEIMRYIQPPGARELVDSPAFVPVFRRLADVAGEVLYERVADLFVVEFRVRCPQHQRVPFCHVHGTQELFYVRRAGSTGRLQTPEECAAWGFARGWQAAKAHSQAAAPAAAATHAGIGPGGVGAGAMGSGSAGAGAAATNAGVSVATPSDTTGQAATAQKQRSHGPSSRARESSTASGSQAAGEDASTPTFHMVAVELDPSASIKLLEGSDSGYGSVESSNVLTLKRGQSHMRTSGVSIIVASVLSKSLLGGFVCPGAILMSINDVSVVDMSAKALCKALEPRQRRRLQFLSPVPGDEAPVRARTRGAPATAAATAAAADGGQVSATRTGHVGSSPPRPLMRTSGGMSSVSYTGSIPAQASRGKRL